MMPVAERSWIGGAPLEGPAVPPYPLEWCREDGAFVELAPFEGHVRTLLARVPSGDGGALRLLAMRLRRDDVRQPSTGGHPVSMRPGDMDDLAVREGLRYRGGTEGAPVPWLAPLVQPAPIVRPCAFDRRCGVFFRLLCPMTLEPLEPCRDAALLRQHGLESPGDGPGRYLYSPRQVAEAGSTGGEALFHTMDTGAGAGARSGCRVVRPDELWRLGAEACGALAPQERERIAATFPQWVEVHGRVPDAEVLAFHPSPVRIVPWVPEDLASAAARLGGESPGDAGGLPFLFRGTPRWPLEVAVAKLDLVLAAGRGVAAVHAQSGQPMLVPTAERFAVTWNGVRPRVHLRDPGVPFRYRLRDAGTREGPMLPVAAPDAPRLLLPPWVGPASFAAEVQCSIRTIEEGAIEVKADHDPLPEHAPGDLVRLQPHGEDADAVILRVREGDRRRAVVERPGEGAAGPPGETGAQRAAATFFRVYGTGADVRAYTLLAAAVLLANDHGSRLDAYEGFLELAERVVEGVRRRGIAVAEAAREVARDAMQGPLDPLAVLHDEGDRARHRKAESRVVPEGPWRDLWSVLLATTVECGRPPGPPIDGLIAELEVLYERFRTELLRREERDHELAGACLRVAGELRTAMLAKAGGSAETGGGGDT